MDVESFLTGIENKHTLREYRRYLTLYAAWCTEQKRNPFDQDAALAWLTGQEGGAGTYNVRMSAIRSWYRASDIKPEAMQKLNFREYKAPRQPVLPFEVRERVINAGKSERDRAFLATLFYSACRWVGLHNMTWERTFLNERIAETIEKRSIERTRSSKLGPARLGGSSVKHLQAYKDWLALQKGGVQPTGTIFDFDYNTGLKILRDAMEAANVKVEKKPGQRGVGTHSVRRGAGTHAYNKMKADSPQEMVKAIDFIRRLLGQHSLTQPLDYLYIEDEEADQKYDELFKEDE